MDKRRINVRAIIFKEGRLLAVKHKTKSGKEASYWALPGGGLDPFEPLAEGIKRELLEETGIHANVGRIIFGQQLRSGRPGRDEELEFFFHITNPHSFNDIALENTTHGNDELVRCEFITPREENIFPDFLQTIDIQSYIDKPQPFYMANYL